MSGFTTFNAAGFGAGGATGNIVFSYDPYSTSSVPTQNIASGTTAAVYTPGSYVFNGSNSFTVTNPAAPNSSVNYPVASAYNRLITGLSGTGDFTVECWWYPTSTALCGLITGSQNNQSASNCWGLIYGANGVNGAVGWFYNGAYVASTVANNVPLNAWSHIAACRSGTTTRVFVNGVMVTFNSNDTNNYRNDLTSLILGTFPGGGLSSGFFSQPRITLSAVYPTAASFTPNPNLGVLPATTFYAPALSSATATSDLSPSGQTLGVFTGAITYSAFGPANSLSNGVFFVDATSNIRTASSSAFNFGTGNFTVEYWISGPDTNIRAMTAINGTATSIGDFVNYTVPTGYAVYNYNATAFAASATGSIVISPNAWNHLAWGKSGSNMTLWVNGQQVASQAFSASIAGNSFSFNTTGTAYANASLGPVRVSNSAVYTTGTNFTPPTTFTNTANTVFLLQGGANLSSYLTDRSVNAIAVSAFGGVTTGSAPVNYGISGNVVGDVSGARNTGLTLRRSGTGSVTGTVFNNNYGGYWNFNGFTGNAYIQTTTPINAQANASFSTWIQTSTANTIITSTENNIAPVPATVTQRGLYIQSTGNLAMYSTSELSVAGNIADGRWHHIVNTFNPISRASVIYLDGVRVASGTLSGTQASENTFYKIGGSSFTNGANGFVGNIGPTAVFSSILTPEQVGQIYRTQAPRFAALSAARAGNLTLSYTGSVQSFTVPQGVTQITVRAVGGAGGASNWQGGGTQAIANGGAGANILANISVIPGATYYAVVGRGGIGRSAANVATAGIADGGGGGVYTGSFNGQPLTGGTGGGFTGLFSIDPTTVDAATAQQYALIVAGGGGGGLGSNNANDTGGNAAATIFGNALSGGHTNPSGYVLQPISSMSSTGTQLVINLNTTGTNLVNLRNYSVNEPISILGASGIANTLVYTVASATGTTVFANVGFGNGTIPAAGPITLSSATVAAGGWNGSAITNINLTGGGAFYANNVAYPGWQGFITNNLGLGNSVNYPTAIAPTAGSALQGGVGGIAGIPTFGVSMGGGGGGGYFGGGGSFGLAGGAGGGGSFANTLVLVGNTVTSGTQTMATDPATRVNGSMTVTWLAAASANTANFGYSGNVQTFTVPAGVTQLSARVIGAAGGRGYVAGAGGGGANIAANIAVTPGQTLYMIVGQGGIYGAWGNNAFGAVGNGSSNTMSLFQGGGGGAGRYVTGSADFWGGQGGGFSGIFNQFPSNASVAANAAILIAGGGGGGGGAGQYPAGGNAAISLTGNSQSGSSGVNNIWYFGQGWSSTGTQIVANVNPMFGQTITAFSPPASIFAPGMALQVTGVGSVLAGEYLTVASVSGNLVFLNNGNVASFPAAGTNTGSNTAVRTFNYANAWTAFNPGTGGGPATTTTGGWYGLQAGSFNASPGTYILATSGSQFAGGAGVSSITDTLLGGGGGGGGGWFGGGGGGTGSGSAGSGGGGSNYVSPSVLNGVTYGTITTNAGDTRINGNIQLSWSNTANFSYTTGTVQTFVVPPYVTKLNARVVGAAGGTTGTYAAGGGANIAATLNVTPGQTLYIVVGRGGTANSTANVAAGNIAQGGGGGAFFVNASPRKGGAGGGFTGIFTQDPSTAANAQVAQQSALLIAGGGGGAADLSGGATPAGNAATTISGNSSPGLSFSPSVAFLPTVSGSITSDGTTITIPVSSANITQTNFSVGEPIGIGGGSMSAGWIGNIVTANTTTITAVYGGGLATPSAGSYTGAKIYAGGYNGSGVAAFNMGGGGWATQSQGGWQGSVYDGGNVAGTLFPTAGTALLGGNGGAPNAGATGWTNGGGGGGGYYGGGGGAGGGGLGGSGGGGGGSNYANAQVVIANTVSYGTIATNTTANAVNGNVFLSW